MRVGVFDSGIGGLSVVKSLLRDNIFDEIIYYGDTARVPYGIKDKSTIVRYGIEAVDFFKNFNLDLIVVACNTVSAYALKEMREVAQCRVIGVVEAGILATQNALIDKNANILIIGTKATINSKVYEIGLNQKGFFNLQAKATSLFIPIVEEEIYSGEILQATMRHYFKDIKKPDAIILGCTHFPLISNQIQEFFSKNTIMIHSGDAIVEQLQNELNITKKSNPTKVEFFASENPDSLKSIAKKWIY